MSNPHKMTLISPTNLIGVVTQYEVQSILWEFRGSSVKERIRYNMNRYLKINSLPRSFLRHLQHLRRKQIEKTDES
jgi:hypothetical protein